MAGYNKGRPSQSDITLSKKMAYILRHGASGRGLQLHPDGYLFVDEMLRAGDLRQFTEEDVTRVVAESDKQRFQITADSNGRLKVRATQGHTINVPSLDMERITDPATAPIVVHGTNRDAWNTIQKQGLSKMRRTHIHFAVGEPGAEGVISGMPNSSDVCIYVNMRLAINDGIEFYRSANNVILSPGNEHGLLLPRYFEKVINRRTRERLM